MSDDALTILEGGQYQRVLVDVGNTTDEVELLSNKIAEKEIDVKLVIPRGKGSKWGMLAWLRQRRRQKKKRWPGRKVVVEGRGRDRNLPFLSSILNTGEGEVRGEGGEGEEVGGPAMFGSPGLGEKRRLRERGLMGVGRRRVRRMLSRKGRWREERDPRLEQLRYGYGELNPSTCCFITAPLVALAHAPSVSMKWLQSCVQTVVEDGAGARRRAQHCVEVISRIRDIEARDERMRMRRNQGVLREKDWLGITGRKGKAADIPSGDFFDVIGWVMGGLRKLSNATLIVGRCRNCGREYVDCTKIGDLDDAMAVTAIAATTSECTVCGPVEGYVQHSLRVPMLWEGFVGEVGLLGKGAPLGPVKILSQEGPRIGKVVCRPVEGELVKMELCVVPLRVQSAILHNSLGRDGHFMTAFEIPGADWVVMDDLGGMSSPSKLRSLGQAIGELSSEWFVSAVVGRWEDPIPGPVMNLQHTVDVFPALFDDSVPPSSAIKRLWTGQHAKDIDTVMRILADAAREEEKEG